jgi:hypothetical protein
LSVKPIQNVEFSPLHELPIETIKLDYYRDAIGLNLNAGNIQLWPRKYFGLNIETEKPWLKISSLKEKTKIVCNFTKRYRNTSINYEFLDKLDTYFVGLDDEFEFFIQKNNLKNLKKISTSNALEMAEVIRSSRFFLGNQSFAFAIAEGMKVNRALEICEIVPNVIPSGHGANEYMNRSALRNILISNNITNIASSDLDMQCSHSLYWD